MCGFPSKMGAYGVGGESCVGGVRVDGSGIGGRGIGAIRRAGNGADCSGAGDPHLSGGYRDPRVAGASR